MSRWFLGGGLSVSIASLAAYAMTVGTPVEKNGIPGEMETVYASMLKQAESLAKSDRVPQALQEIQGIPRNSRHFLQAQQFQESWSREVLQQALEQYRQGSLEQALAILKPIPSSTGIAPQAQAFRVAWTQEARFLNQALTAAAKRDWSSTLNSIEALRGTGTYTTPRVQTLLEQAIANAFDPTVTTIRLATAPPIQSNPPQIERLPQLPAPKLNPLAVDVESAIAQSEPTEPRTNEIAANPAPIRQAAPVPVTPILPVPALPPAPAAVASSESIPAQQITPPPTQQLSQSIAAAPQGQPVAPSAASSQTEAITRTQSLPVSSSSEESTRLPEPSQLEDLATQFSTTNLQQPTEQRPQAESTLPQSESERSQSNQTPVQLLPTEPLETDIVAELPQAERVEMLKPLDNQTLQKVTTVLQASAKVNESRQPVGQSTPDQ